MAHYLGIDLGGTNIKAGVMDAAGGLLAQATCPTPSTGFDDVVAALVKATDEVVALAGLRRDQIRAAGIGSPGLVDATRGVVRDAPNLPGFREAPLGPALATRFGCPVFVENDANAAAFGEYWAGVGRRKADEPAVRDLILLTLGTGVGGGLVSDGRLLHGGHGMGGEIGHMIVFPDGRLCGCGQYGCLEAHASAGAMVAMAAEVTARGESTVLAAADGGPMTAKRIFEASSAGDAAARRIVAQAADALGLACISLSRILDPQMIALGGGVAAAGDELLQQVRASYRRRDWRLAGSAPVRIDLAVLGNTAGMVGAGSIACNACGP